MPRRALLIVNENSSQGRGDLRPVLDILRHDGGMEVTVRKSHSREHVAEIIGQDGDGVDMVIMAGGDGTMNTAVDVLYERGLTLGVLPLGTANDLARTLGIPAGIQAACRAIAHGRQHRIDLGRVNGKLFFNVASVGAAAQLSKHLDRELKERWGVLSYPIRVRDVLEQANAFDAEIVDEDGHAESVRSIQIAIGNGRCYGGGMKVAEDSAIDDGRLDLYSLEPQSMWRLVLTLPFIRSGHHGKLEGSVAMSGTRFTVRTAEPMEVATDGEVTTRTPAVFEVLPEALSVMVPNGRNGEGVSRDMLRDNRVVLLDDVIVAVKRSIQDMRQAVDSHEGEGDALTDALRTIADRRMRMAEALEDEVRALGDLPSSPDADRQAFSHLALRFKALLSGDEARTLADAACSDEDALAEAIQAALAAEDMPAPVKETLTRLLDDVDRACREIRAAAG